MFWKYGNFWSHIDEIRQTNIAYTLFLSHIENRETDAFEISLVCDIHIRISQSYFSVIFIHHT